MGVLHQLRAVVGANHVLTGDQVRERTVSWGKNLPCMARALVRPASTSEVSSVLKLCNDYKIPVVPHGGRTGLVKGAYANEDEIVLSLERMKNIEDIDITNRCMTVQAGVPLQTVQESAKDAGMLFALDIGARGTATIGGNIATNAGGGTVIRYGSAREQVLGLEVVLADGTVLSSLNRLIKNNSGYDLKHLFIGSEGSLGIVTRIILRLRPLTLSRQTALLAAPSFEMLTKLLQRAEKGLIGTLTSFEVMWQDFYKQVTTPPAAKPPLSQEYPYYVLMEACGVDGHADSARFEALMKDLFEKRIIIDAVIAQSEYQAQALWALREDFDALFRVGYSISFDIGLSIGDMEEYTDRVSTAVQAECSDARLFFFGHLGDNNIHICICLPVKGAAAEKAVKEIVYSTLHSYQNAVSAEHGIGLEKIDYLHYSRSPQEIALMRVLKHALDPCRILNRGKIFSDIVNDSV